MAETLSTESVMAVLPPGVILPWYAQEGSVPRGWAICDGSNDTPDLRGRFLLGVADFADVGKPGGRHPFKARKCRTDDLHEGSDWVVHADRRVNGDKIDLRPPFDTVLFIMKL